MKKPMKVFVIRPRALAVLAEGLPEPPSPAERA